MSENGRCYKIGLIGSIGLGLLFSLLASTSAQTEPEPKIRWDIQQPASARAQDGSRITLTGTGTFVPGNRDDVTGGGDSVLRGPAGEVAESGAYSATQLLFWQEAPSTESSTSDSLAGLAVLRIRYSNGREGVLVVSCHLPGTPDSVFEGIHASMGFVHFWNAPTGSTLFTVQRQ